MPPKQSRLALEWREWMTEDLLGRYFSGRTFYTLQVGVWEGLPGNRFGNCIHALAGKFKQHAGWGQKPR